MLIHKNCEAMKFQLVIQFRPTGALDFEKLVAMEDALITELGDSAIVDGHDIGSGEFNIFVVTDHPKESFVRTQRLLEGMKPEGAMNVAYRDPNDERFVILWPPNSPEF